MIEVRQADVTTLAVDAIQNAANGILQHGAGVAGAIRAAGHPYVQRESNAALLNTGVLDTGAVVVTSAGDMPARYVLHAVTMMYPGGRCDTRVVRACTAATLKVAYLLGVDSLALVALGTGIGGLDVRQCAIATIEVVLEEPTRPDIVIAVVGDEAEEAFSQELAARAPVLA